MKNELIKIIAEQSQGISDNVSIGYKYTIAILGVSWGIKFYSIFGDKELLGNIATIVTIAVGILSFILALIRIINEVFSGKVTKGWINKVIKYIKQCKCL
jgi:hypothetical protein